MYIYNMYYTYNIYWDSLESQYILDRSDCNWIPWDSRIEFRDTRGFSEKFRGYLVVILRFVENRMAVKRKTPARTTTEGKRDPFHNSLPLQWTYIEVMALEK